MDIWRGGGYNRGNILNRQKEAGDVNLGETIYRLRTERNMSQGDLADKLSELAESVTSYGILGQVAWNPSDPNTANHWVYINSSPIDGGELGVKNRTFVEIMGTSDNDIPSKRPAGWLEKDGKIYKIFS